MLKNNRTFYGLILLILISTLIVMGIYTLTFNVSINTVQEDIENNNLNRLRFLVNNLDHNVSQLNMLSIALEVDPKIGLLSSIDQMDSYEQVRLMIDLTDKIKLQSFSQGWSNQISIYTPLLDKWIGTNDSHQTVLSNLKGGQWEYEQLLGKFTTYRNNKTFMIRVSFPQSNLSEILNRAKIDNNDPFFYQAGNQAIIMNKTSDSGKVNKIIPLLAPLLNNQEEGTETLSIDGKEYMVNYLRSKNLGWYVIDYLPLDQAVQPILRTKNRFYIACIMLFLAGVITIMYLYRQVQVPMVALLKAVRFLKKGDFSYRIQEKSSNEFQFLYENFNDMANQIEDLIQKVYKEKIISREAMIKQLQAQINPHFLYNCLFFIDNMNRLGNDEAVTTMTKNLAEYFRYTTRLDKPCTSLAKELEVVENYLTIQCLRMKRLRYQISIPDSMKHLSVPKLLIQPLVENSIIHGIEKKQNSGLIRINGSENESQYCLYIEDDGKGLTNEKIQELNSQIKQPLDDSMGCALWNIRQRLQIYFESPAGIKFEQSSTGGLCVTLYWSKNECKEE